MITSENYEEYMMMHADGELSPADEQELMSFLYEHPELQHELTAFTMAKLRPDDHLVYTRKVTLLKPEGGARIVRFAPWQRYAVAAGVAAVLLFGTYKVVNNLNDNERVAAIAMPVRPEKNAAVENAAQTMPVADASPAPATKGEFTTQAKPEPASNAALAQAGHKKTMVKEPAHNRQGMSAQQAAPTSDIPISKVKPVEMVAWENTVKISTPVVTNVPPVAIYVCEGNDETKRSIVDKLPIDELKKEGMENVVTAMANGYDKLNALKQGLSETVVSFKIEKRKLVVSF